MTEFPQASVVRWLRSGEAWPQPRIVETHAALIFLVDARVYKLKKAVNLGYLDFSTLERRHQALERELTLNRRTAPSLYLRVLPITRGRDGGFALDEPGEVVDWLLEMRRFPDDALLSAIADRGELREDIVDRLAAGVAAFHDRAAPVSGHDWPAAVARIAAENDQDLRGQAALLSAAPVDATIAAREAVRAASAVVLAGESSDVRHCHGDLHLGNAFLDHGEPALFDCIEFDDFYAMIPPLYDLSFLLMDLEARQLGKLSNRALNAWWVHREPARWRGTMRSLGALPLYLSLRAEIRAKTLARVPNQIGAARNYLELAREVAAPRPARLVAIGGPSGTGKSLLARSIAWRVGRRPGAVHLRSDQIRKRLKNLQESERLPLPEYTGETAKQVYAEIHDLAALALAAGHCVIMDAVFAREEERHAARRIAREANAEFQGVWLTAPTALLEKRLSERRNDVSDANVGVLRRQLTYDLGHIDWQTVDASPDAARVAEVTARQLGIT